MAPVAQLVWYRLTEAPPPADARLRSLCAPPYALRTHFQLRKPSVRISGSSGRLYLRLVFLTCHHEYRGFRERLFVRFTAQQLGHHLRAPV